MDCNCCTFSVAVAAGAPVMVAVIVVVPRARALATPPTAIVATAVFDELQVTREVASLTLPSLYRAEAVNCWVVAIATVGFGGETCNETATGAPTIMLVLPVTPSSAAVINDVPIPTAVASPVLVMLATVVVPEVHVAWFVTSVVTVVPSGFL